MLEHISIEKVFFLDIETVPQHPEFNDCPESTQMLWSMKTDQLKKYEEFADTDKVYERAGIYAEFGKIICISVGKFAVDNNHAQFRIKSYYGDNEKEILIGFSELIAKSFKQGNLLCAHNGKEFDFPYISRRMIVNGIPIPDPLDNYGKKPWETEHLLDTMHLWRFGDYKSYTSLQLLCHILEIPTPKDDIQGKDVWKVYWQEKNLDRIVSYCEKDVLAIARLLQRFKMIDIIKDDQVRIIKP